MKRAIFGLVVFLGVAGPAAVPAGAGTPEAGSILSGLEPAPTPGLMGSGLLDLSRLSFRHSLTYGVTSAGGSTNSGGLWLTEIGYQAARPLWLRAEVGAVIDPSAGWLSENSFFLHRLSMDYAPSRNFQLHFSYVNMPPTASDVFGSAYQLGSGYGYRPWSVPAPSER